MQAVLFHMKTMFLMLPILSIMLLGLGEASAQIVPGQEDFTGTGPTGHVFDITTLESYRHFPEITRDMLMVGHGNASMTAEFGQAYDEINLIAFGYEDHIVAEHVEFLEDLDVTLLGGHGNALTIGIHPSQEDRLAEIRERLGTMYPNVEITVDVGEFSYLDVPTVTYTDIITKSSTVNTAIPNGGGESISNSIQVTEHATLNSFTVDIVVDHEDHDEMYMKLIAPSGREITVFSRERGHADGVQTFTYSSTTTPGLGRLAGSDIFGTWTLNIRDAYTGSDTGTFQSWSLNFSATPVSSSSDGSSSSGGETAGENLLERFFNLIFGDTVCNSLADDCVPKVGGQYVSYIGRDDTERHSSIGLGGLNTTQGVEGFLVAGHAPGHGNVGKIIAHELTDTNNVITYTKPLGQVVINNDARPNGLLLADIALVEYPKLCTVTEDQLCYGDTDEYRPTVKQMEIYRSNGQTYNVTDWDRMTTNEAVNAIGFTANRLLTGTVHDDLIRVTLPDNNYAYVAVTTLAIGEGDSGAPVFTPPNSNHEVEIMGTVMGRVVIGTTTYSVVVPWNYISADLGLQRISD